jgi:hypothetical protein
MTKRLTVVMLAMAVLAAGCGNGKEGSGGNGGGEADIDLSTPNALIQTLHDAFKAQDWDTATKCVAPELRDTAKQLFGLMSDMQSAVTGLCEAIESKFDAETAKPFRDQLDMFGKGIPSPFEKVCCAEGKIMWEKIKIEEEGDKAKVLVEGESKKKLITKIEGKWYVLHDEDETVEDVKTKTAKMAESLGKMVEGMKSVTAEINAGKVTKENLGQKLEAAMQG